MRVWFVTSSFPEVSEAFAGVEVRSLRRMGADVQVFSLRPNAKLAAKLLSQWGLSELIVSTYSTGTIRAAAAFLVNQPRKAAWTLVWLLRSAWRRPVLLGRCLILLPRMFEIFMRAEVERPDVLHLFWGHYPSVLARIVQRWLPSTTVSVSLSAYDLLYAFPPTVEAANAADCLWTHAECNREQLAQLGICSQNLHVAVRGVDLRLLPGSCDTKQPRKVVTAGRMVRGKGMEYVLRAFELAAREFPEAQLVMLGDGSDRPRLENIARALGISDKVVFRGNVSHEAVFSELGTASVFMLLSEWYAERLPNVVKEAIACKCVCIVSDTPGIMELMHPFQNRFVVEASAWRQAADHLSCIFSNPDYFDSDREKGRKFAIDQLDADRVAKKRIDAWRAAMQLRRPAHVD